MSIQIFYDDSHEEFDGVDTFRMWSHCHVHTHLGAMLLGLPYSTFGGCMPCYQVPWEQRPAVKQYYSFMTHVTQESEWQDHMTSLAGDAQTAHVISYDVAGIVRSVFAICNMEVNAGFTLQPYFDHQPIQLINPGSHEELFQLFKRWILNNRRLLQYAVSLAHCLELDNDTSNTIWRLKEFLEANLEELIVKYQIGE